MNLLGLIFFFFYLEKFIILKNQTTIRLAKYPICMYVFTCTAACITKTIMSRRTCESRGQREGFAGCMVHRIHKFFIDLSLCSLIEGEIREATECLERTCKIILGKARGL